MKTHITTHVAVAYSHCPRKAFLLLSGCKSGNPHEYVEILAQKQRAAQSAYLEDLSQKEKDTHPYATHGLDSKSPLITNATLQTDMFQAECGLLTKVTTHSKLLDIHSGHHVFGK